MDKQKQIQTEELIGIIQGAVGGCATYWASLIAEEVLKYYQPKIPENAVVLETSAYESLEIKNYRDVITERVRKETAEKFAELLKALVADRNCNEDYDWEDVQVDGQIFVECVDEICKEIIEGKV